MWVSRHHAVPEPTAPRRPAWSTAHVCLSKPNTVTKEQKRHETRRSLQSVIVVKLSTGSEEEDHRISASGSVVKNQISA